MGVSLWGESPLYETGSLKEDHHAKWITPTTKYEAKAGTRRRWVGGAATIRGKEAGAKTCEATDRNVNDQRFASVPGPGCRGEWAIGHRSAVGGLVGEAVPNKATR